MKKTISPGTVSGTIFAPASKSAMQRACAGALIRGAATILHNPGISADDEAALGIIQQLGATVYRENDTIRIESNGIRPVSDTLDCGESGLSVRMFTPLAALSPLRMTITGSGSLIRRPLSFFNEVLPKLKVRCESNEGFLPLRVEGPLQPADIAIDGSLSSQFLTGLLFAYSASQSQGKTITVHGLNSKPYIDLTLQLMDDFGLKVPVNRNYEQFYFDERTLPSPGDILHYTVEGDWSGAAFLLVAGAITGGITVKGLDVFSAQADKAILQALMQTGARMSIEEERIEVRTRPLDPFHVNATDCPDLFPPLVALASYCNGKSVIEGVRRLEHKESNRALTLQEEFQKMNVSIMLQDDLMIIEGGGEVQGASVHSHHDHRIAMACATAALRANGQTVIDGAEAINKSYPQFWKHLEHMTSPD